MGPYMEIYEKASRDKGLPEHFLPSVRFVESRENEEREISPAGAEGPFQLMPGTAKDLGLRRDSHVNESFDPIESGIASGKFIKELMATYGGSLKWSLEAYNRGPKKVSKNTRRTPYAFMVFAAMEIFENPRMYGIDMPNCSIEFARYAAEKGDNLYRVSKKVNVPATELERHNPQILNPNKLPIGTKIWVPKG